MVFESCSTFFFDTRKQNKNKNLRVTTTGLRPGSLDLLDVRANLRHVLGNEKDLPRTEICRQVEKGKRFRTESFLHSVTSRVLTHKTLRMRAMAPSAHSGLMSQQLLFTRTSAAIMSGVRLLIKRWRRSCVVTTSDSL